MARISKLKKLLLKELEIIANRKPANKPNIAYHLIIDKAENRFLIVALGWHEQEYEHRILIHLEIKGEKIWIYEDLVDPGIVERMIEKGAKESDFFLHFIPEKERETPEPQIV